MIARSLLSAGLALLAFLGLAQSPFVSVKSSKAAVAARKAEFKRFGLLRLMGDPRLLRTASSVGTQKPLDAARATTLARAYFSMRSGGCGGVDSPVDRGAFWSFSTKEGAAGRSGAAIEVDKATGRTSSKGFATVDRPSGFARYILPDAVRKRLRP